MNLLSSRFEVARFPRHMLSWRLIHRRRRRSTKTPAERVTASSGDATNCLDHESTEIAVDVFATKEHDTSNLDMSQHTRCCQLATVSETPQAASPPEEAADTPPVSWFTAHSFQFIGHIDLCKIYNNYVTYCK